MLLLVIALPAFVVSCLGTRALITLLRRGAVLDRPNERSSHVAPTPRGGGIAVVGTIVCAWLVLCGVDVLPGSAVVVALAALVLALVCWLDDLRGLPPAPRLLLQVATVAVSLWAAPGGETFQGWLPPGLDLVFSALLWLWFVNLFNFMDGIDGIAGSEAVAIAVGILLVAGGAADLTAPAVAVAAAALGFLVWNWAPARIFLGDVGSVPLGYLLGCLLLELARRGEWRAALILPLYFLADASLTLLRRLVRGERVWQPHREHFYQRAVQRGLGHAAVVRRVIAADIVLVLCACAAASGWGFAALGIALLDVAVLLVALGRGWR